MRKRSFRGIIVGLFVGLILGALLSFLSVTGGLGKLQELEFKLLDVMFSYRRQIKTTDAILHIDIDDKSVKEIGRPPWPRIYQARALDVLTELGAKIAVFDLEFDDESVPGLKDPGEKKAIENLIKNRFGYLKKDLQGVLTQAEKREASSISLEELKAIVSKLEGVYDGLTDKFLQRLNEAIVENDSEFAKSVRKNASVILPFRFSSEQRLDSTDNELKRLIEDSSKELPQNKEEIPQSPALVGPIHLIARHAGGFGFTNIYADDDGIYRHIYLLWRYGDRIYLHLSLRAILNALNAPLDNLDIAGGHITVSNVTYPPFWKVEYAADSITIPIDRKGRLLINWPTSKLKKWPDVFTHIPFSAVENVSRIRDKIASCQDQLEIQLTKLSEQSFGGARAGIKMNPVLIKDPQKLKEALEKNEEQMLSSPLAKTVNQVMEADLKGDDQETEYLRRLKGFFEDIAALKKRKAELTGQERELLDRLKKIVSGKICLIGETASLTPDLKHVPVDPAYPGVLFHSALINQILTRQFIKEAPPYVNAVLILAACILVCLVVSRSSVFQASIFTVLLMLLYGGGVFYLFSERMIYVKAGSAPLGMLFSYIIMTAYRQLTEEKEKRRIRSLFEHYNSPAMVEQMVQDPSRVRLGGEKRELTVFFSDIEGFTSISEKMPPEKLVAFLNRYLGAMTDIILESGGTLDKYEGDAIIAFWGAPLEIENHARTACFAALDNQKKLAELREALAGEGLPGIKCRIGLSSGEMIVGNMGSSRRFDYTVMGDAVNLGQRLEVSNKLYGTCILISERTRELAGEFIDVRELDILRVKGKEKPVKVYELLARKGETPEDLKKILPLFKKGLEEYRTKQWDKAIDIFSQILEMKPDDGPSLAYLERCRAFKQNPPPDAWDGLFDSQMK